MLNLFAAVVLLSAFVLMLLDKLKVIEWLQLHGNNFFHKLAHCQFCMSFWVSLFFSIVLAVVFWHFAFLLFPIFAAPLIRNLL